ncbi:SH3 domain-containing protein [Adhaeribacter rhizoryzae]|uniref:SH3 domain-containing protein n=1 Tax=Adhaeribacter rhizoryzae TaxID=2607907 RepID=A0A5M6DC08_9BACT|nr:SH3 domain-containing protein [Adhaeribacter rhizoryzae]KAA5545077.1 SH3 domain-containing protein [Adhaeribacter rhizoryzae]
MKKAFFTLALLVQVGFAMAHNNTTLETQVRHENVKMFQQAATSTNVLETLNANDRVQFIRKHNAQWGIITVNGKTGYVLLSELSDLKKVKL